jgi:DNA-binding FadR family transcriptional regulator
MNQPTPSAIPLSAFPLPPRIRRSASIAENLRQLIDNGHLQPGDRLPPECDLCRQFGVSRTTLREAIQMLRTTGLLDVSPGRGSFVRVPDVSHLMRDLLFAGRHGGINPSHIARLHVMLLRDAMHQLPRLTSNGRQELYRYVLSKTSSAHENALAEENWQMALVALCGNPLQRTLLECLLTMAHTHRLERYANPDEVLRTIQVQLRVNGAVTEGDWPLAERVLSQFITMVSASANHVAAFPVEADADTPLTATE